MTCVALFTISSFLCGIAPSLGWLIFFRVLQGLGGGGLGPSEQSILADTFPPAKRGMAFAVYGMAVVLAPAIGPTLGGFITDHFYWRWVFFINVPVGSPVALPLEPHGHRPAAPREAEGARRGASTTSGLSLIALGLGALEVVLDKGQEDDWFASHFIVVVLDHRGRRRSCRSSSGSGTRSTPSSTCGSSRAGTSRPPNVMMFVLGVTLFGTTVLLPQFLQVLMGYTAEQAGMALSPGGFAHHAHDAARRRSWSPASTRGCMIAFGFTVLSLSLFYMTTHLYLGIDFRTAVSLRAFQSVGLAFLFVPINTLVYAGVPPEKNNAVSGIVNLSRNMGGDVGIAFVTTLIARRSQEHQAYLSTSPSATGRYFQAHLGALTQAMVHKGLSSADASRRAARAIYGQLLQQATTLAYIDVLRIFAVMAALMVPMLLFTKAPRTGKAAMGH